MYVPCDVVRSEVGGVPDVAVPAGDGFVEAELLHLLNDPVLARVQMRLGGREKEEHFTQQISFAHGWDGYTGWLEFHNRLNSNIYHP